MELLEQTVASEALAWPERARAAVITDNMSYCGAADLLLGIKALRVKIADTFDPHIKRAHDTHKGLLREKSEAEAPLAQAEQIVKLALRNYDLEQERIRQAEQARLDAIAKREEEDRILAAALAKENEGHEWGDDGLKVEAQADLATALAQPLTSTAAPVMKATPKVAGIVHRKEMKFQIVDESKLPRQYLMPNETKIRGVVRSLGHDANIPGVKVYEETTVAAGRR